MRFINQYKKEIQSLCEKYNVKSLYVFGSHARGDYTPESDVDLLVEFEGVSLYDYFDNYYDFFQGLEKLLNKKVDLVSSKYIENPYLRSVIDSEKIKIYEQDQNLAA